MKNKKSHFLLFLLLPLCFSSCQVSKKDVRTNYFYPGKWSGINEENEYQNIVLEVTEIDEETFNNSEGVNTVKDIVINRFFSLSLSVVEKDNVFMVNFQNMKAYRNTRHYPVTYLDDNFIYIYPCNRIEKHNGYSISVFHQSSLDFKFSAVLSIVEE